MGVVPLRPQSKSVSDKGLTRSARPQPLWLGTETPERHRLSYRDTKGQLQVIRPLPDQRCPTPTGPVRQGVPAQWATVSSHGEPARTEGPGDP